MITIQPFEVNYFSENTYVLYDETKEAVLIDCGCLFPQEQKALSDFIAQKGLTLKRLLCTHLHLDHIFGCEFVYNTYGLSPEAHKMDVDNLPSAGEQAKRFGFPMKVTDIPVKHYLVNGETVTFSAAGQTLTAPVEQGRAALEREASAVRAGLSGHETRLAILEMGGRTNGVVRPEH